MININCIRCMFFFRSRSLFSTESNVQLKYVLNFLRRNYGGINQQRERTFTTNYRFCQSRLDFGLTFYGFAVLLTHMKSTNSHTHIPKSNQSSLKMQITTDVEYEQHENQFDHLIILTCESSYCIINVDNGFRNYCACDQ